MVRNRRALLIALLCVLAVALAAATLANPQQPAGGDGLGASGPDPSGTAVQSGEGGSGVDAPELDGGEGTFALDPICVPALATPTATLGVLGFLALVGGLAYWRDDALAAFAAVFLTGMLVLPVWLLLTNCSQRPYEPSGGVFPDIDFAPPPGGDASGSAGSELLFSPPTVLLALLAVAVLLGAVAFRATGDDERADSEDVPEPTPEADEETLDALGGVAGDAADRIADDADVENEVYRAWREMTGHLDVANPETSTPAEFAAAASDAGMDREHVGELTDLFRSVRYGGAAVTADREQRALDALRAIESSYGGDR